MDFIGLFQTRGVLEILMYLKSKPAGAQKIDLRQELGLISNTQVKAHKVLFDAKLITIKPDPVKHIFILTPDGERIAELLSQIKEIVDQLNKSWKYKLAAFRHTDIINVH
jgi:predicted transcriptional regulator